MRYPLLLILLSGLIFLSCDTEKNEMADDDFPAFKIQRGTNIAHWLSQSNRRGSERAAFFSQRDIEFIDSVGFDHIRLPVDEVQLWDENGQRHEDAFGLLRECLRWCNDAGLRVVLDLHILRSHYFNAKEKPLWNDRAEQDKFIRLWKDLSAAVGEWPTGMLAYEFMNEPVADDPEQWNDLLARVRDSIRFWEPERVLVIGSNRWQSAETFDVLEIPPGDPNIILSFHFYEPFYLTHTGASWTPLKDFTGEVNYPGQIVVNGATPDEMRTYDISTLEKMMEKPLRLADSLNLQLYCGEFGVIEKAPTEPRLAWYRDMVSLFEKHGIAYANWNYKAGSFGIVDANMEPDADLVRILTADN